MVGIELVADRETRAPFPRGDRIAEAVVRGARERGVLLYSGTGNANGVDGDTILLGPPFVVTDAELDRIVAVLADTIEAWPRPGGRRRGRRGLIGLRRARPRFAPMISRNAPSASRMIGRSSPANDAPAMLAAADERQEAAEPQLPAPAAAADGADQGDEQERDPEAERAQAVVCRSRPR